MPAHINLPRGLLHRHAGGLMTLLRLADLAIVGIAAWLAYLWRFEDRGFDREFALLVLLAVLLAALVFSRRISTMNGEDGAGQELRQVLGAWRSCWRCCFSTSISASRPSCFTHLDRRVVGIRLR